MEKWYKKSYRRNLVDMHIEDWDESFLSKINPQEYVENLKKAQVQSAMIYANSHVGYCNWPTKEGHMHGGLKGKDFFGEMVDLVHKEHMDAIGYYTLVFVNDEYERFPQWRMKTSEGAASRDLRYGWVVNGRYGLCCPNNQEYRSFVERQVTELIENYPLEGLFYDMNFFPIVCYCDSCRQRYKEETNKEIPTIVDWTDPDWLLYARTRQKWLVDSAEFFVNIVKSRKPEMTVEHNFVTFLKSWICGCTDEIADTVDFNSGDSYGDMACQNFVGKMHNTMSKNLPFEFMVSRCFPGLSNHTSIKPKQYLYLENAMALANGGAFFFIDAIDPEGTMCSEVYETMGEIFEETKKYEPFIGGRIKADVAVYYSSHSKCSMDENGKTVEEVGVLLTQRGVSILHNDSAISAAEILKENHIPYTVLTKKNLVNLNQYAVLVLSSIVIIEEEEEAEIKKWVREGGRLYITSPVSLPLVSELLDLTYEGRTKQAVTYLYPTKEGSFMLEGTLNRTAPVTVLQAQSLVRLNGTAKVLANIGVPYTDPANPQIFASIHSNPPKKALENPGIILGEYGAGKVVWSSTPIESAPAEYETQRIIFGNLIRELADREFSFKSNAAPYIDFTLVDQQEESRYLINCVNCQSALPILPVYHVDISIKTDGRKIVKACSLPNEEEIEFQVQDNYVTLNLEKLDIYNAMLVYYQ